LEFDTTRPIGGVMLRGNFME